MKISSETRFIVVGKAEPTKSQDGKTTYYRVACMQEGQATNVSLSEEIYDSIPSGIVDARFATSYDDKYQSFRIDALLEIISVNGVAYGTSPDAKPDVKPDTKASGSTPDKK
ncbi:MAG: hypothetical protein K2O65_04755 [Lachnospiraceae bacterium]|nr:hypothetical protein [Lachnospiraceae bacterium]